MGVFSFRVFQNDSLPKMALRGKQMILAVLLVLLISVVPTLYFFGPWFRGKKLPMHAHVWTKWSTMKDDDLHQRRTCEVCGLVKERYVYDGG